MSFEDHLSPFIRIYRNDLVKFLKVKFTHEWQFEISMAILTNNNFLTDEDLDEIFAIQQDILNSAPNFNTSHDLAREDYFFSRLSSTFLDWLILKLDSNIPTKDKHILLSAFIASFELDSVYQILQNAYSQYKTTL